MRSFASEGGKQLYNLLPSFYRERDNSTRDEHGEIEDLGDLGSYLDACGILLDRIRRTLEQRHADSFPDNPREGQSCQDWLIPYFARLLDVRLVSPHVNGQRDEVANAISWRQRKGTLTCIEQIFQAITQDNGEAREGWRRVAVTPRIGRPLLPPAAYGLADKINLEDRFSINRHPEMPAVTMDLRCPSRGVQTTAENSLTRVSYFAGIPYKWIQANHHGVPVVAGAYDDVSRRTVDMRTPNWQQGHSHPKRMLLYSPIPMGLFSRKSQTINNWQEIESSPYVTITLDKDAGHLSIRNRSEFPLEISGDITLRKTDTQADNYTIEGLRFNGTLTVEDGWLELRKVTAKTVQVNTLFVSENKPTLIAQDCLIGKANVPSGAVNMESCTVLDYMVCQIIHAANCIFANRITDPNGNVPGDGRIRFSRIPDDLEGAIDVTPSTPPIKIENCTIQQAEFFDTAYGADPVANPLTADAGVLKPSTHEDICFGAEDGGEMGAYHRGRSNRVILVSQAQAVDLPNDHGYVLKDLVFVNGLTINSGTQAPLRLLRVAVRDLDVDSDAIIGDEGEPKPALFAKDCLMKSMSIDNGLAQLEYCTVLNTAEYQLLRASDCIFNETLSEPTEDDCIRYCRIPPAIYALQDGATGLRFPFCTSDEVIFFNDDFDMTVSEGEPGCGVLHLATPASVSFGAEDGGEMGAYHHKRYRLQGEAVLDKLKDYLPVGMEAVLIPGPQLNQPPFKSNNNESTEGDEV